MAAPREPNRIVREDLAQIVATDLPWERLHGADVVVTGGGGFLGSYLVRALLAAGDAHDLGLAVHCVARRMDSVRERLAAHLAHPRLRVVLHDVTHPVPAAFPRGGMIIHAASQASPRFYGTDPVGTLLANVAGTMHLLGHAAAHGVRRFLFVSSGEVYGTPLDPDRPFSEAEYGTVDPMRVRSCYAEGKRVAETMCVAWAHQHGVPTSVVRPFHTYGPGMAADDGRVFADFTGDVVAGRDIVLTSDGQARRPFCYVSDAIRGMLTVLLRGATAEAYNVANPEAEISVGDLARLLAGLHPARRVGVIARPAPPDPAGTRSPIPRQLPSIAKLRTLGWSPAVGLEAGFRRTIESYL